MVLFFEIALLINLINKAGDLFTKFSVLQAQLEHTISHFNNSTFKMCK